MLQSLGWDSLEKRSAQHSATIMYKAINNLVYLPFPDTVQPSFAKTRAKHPYKFMHIFANSNAYKYSFFPRVIPIWNSLPSVAVCADSIKSFQVNSINHISHI